jgi:peptidoglycan/LPS O-acetylase OafA/YrhL
VKNTTHSHAQLDSLRGIASLQVLMQHLFLTSAIMLSDIRGLRNSPHILERLLFWTHFTPLHFFYMAYEAVVFFFVLSGFVLYSSLNRPVTPGIYAQYIIKRFFRLFMPFIAAIVLSVICRELFYHPRDLSTLSTWFKTMWNHQVSFREFMELIVFISHDFHNVVTSLWSIEIEIKISLLIPAFIFFINIFRRLKAVDVILNTAILAISFFIFNNAPRYFVDNADVVYNLFVMRFTFAFIAGMMLSKYLHYIMAWLHDLSLAATVTALIVAFYFYCIDWISWMMPQPLRFDGYHNEIMILASCMFIAISFNKRVYPLLAHKRLVHLGNISFSLYLLHPVLLLVFMHLFVAVLPLSVVWSLVLGSSLVVAHYFYTYFEMPINNFGRKLAGELVPHKKDVLAKSGKAEAV